MLKSNMKFYITSSETSRIRSQKQPSAGVLQKSFFKNLANLREKNCAGVSFHKVVELKPATLFIERLRRCVFWYILPNLFRTTFMQSTPRHLLLRVVKKSSLFSFLISSIITSTFIIVIQIF